ncbi:granulocyte colony-stimulating factor receptor-like [Heptranchias perlo]|uniref:granulocyte colony-stimulating factor receptor-like n=1 Tax=Heptranchias perlo TaxID=212740 RepID=UPI0035599B36
MLRLFSTDDISVLAQNVLGTSESDTLCLDPMDAVKLEHPVISRVQGDSANSHCLIIHWALDINLGMMCELGYRARHGQAWRQVLVLVNDWLREQSLCQLSGGTEYRVRLRCTILGSMGHWSDWSPESSGQTSESPPVGIPDVWWHFENSDQDGKKYIRLFWKELKQSEVNGRIRGYRVSHRWEAQSSHTELTLCNTTNRTCRIPAPTGSGNICITAYNRAGESPAAELGLKTLHHRAFALLSPSVSITPINEHSLQIKWSAPRAPVTGYVVEWFEISEGVTCDINWKKESADSISSVLQENIKPMKRYAISIHPLHSKGLGIPVSTEAYSKQGAPLIGPEVSGDHIWESKAEVIWEEIPINKRQGFIRNYTIFYSDKTGPIRYIVSNALERRYTLTGLLADTDYQVQVMATTDAGGTNGSVMNLTTKKSEDGDMGTILASLCTLFLFLMSLQLLMCFIRRNVMTGNLWPKIPDPANSSLSSWIPETRHQDCKCSEGAPDSIVSSFTLLERGSDKNTAFAIKSMHLVGEEKMTSMNDDGKRPSDGECLHCLSETPACLVHTLYHNVSGGSQYASVLHYKGQKTPPPFFLRSDSTQALLHDLTPSPKPFENPWFSKSAENDSELSQDISLSDVIVGEEAIWKNFPLLWGLVSEHSGDTMVTPTASFH